MCEWGPKFGYLQNHGWFDCLDKAIHVFEDINIQILAQCKEHPGTAVGTSQFRDEYIMEKINKWVQELRVLSKIAKIEPQAASTCFLSGYRHKFCYMRAIPGIGKLLRKVDEVILTEFIPAITERKLLSLAPRELGISIFEELCEIEYQNSIKIEYQNTCLKNGFLWRYLSRRLLVDFKICTDLKTGSSEKYY